jgi:4-hydroxyphenylacetate 3-monooxygenase
VGLKTGAEYLEGLNDNRRVIYDGKVVENVLDEPGLRSTARTVAQYYDMQNRPELQDLLTYETPDGDRAHLSFIEPKSIEDLRRRAAAFGAWAEVTGGLMGRSPDYLNSAVMAIGNGGAAFGINDPAYAKRAYDIYLHCRQNDITMTHTFVSPMTDRFTPLSQQEKYVNAGVVDTNEDGIFVTGARMVATLAPFCDENVSFVGPGPLAGDGDDIYALGFTCEVDHPDVKWICRDKHDPEQSHFDAPISSRLDEMDAIAIWENAFIPWERVFICRDVQAYNMTPPVLKLNQALGPHVLAKNIAKTRFLLGLGHLIAESSQISSFVNVQERLGDILMWLRTMEGLSVAAVEGGELNPANGLYYVADGPVQAALRLYPEVYPRIIGHLRQLGGGGYVSLPQEATFEMAGEAIDRYYQGVDQDGKDKVALFRLAWDVCGSAWGGRQELYERFYTGDNTKFKAGSYMMYDKTEATEMVARILQPPEGDARFAWPEWA